MKVFVLYARENWITDELAKEWITNNSDKYTSNIDEADTIWVLSDYIIHKVPYYYLQNKRVITSIHHITPWKVNAPVLKHFKELDKITDIFHTNNKHILPDMSKYFTKPIRMIPFYHNENVWKILKDKNTLRNNYAFRQEDFLVGSFQKDTESVSVWNGTFLPKLEKGPDLFVEAVRLLKKHKYPNLKVVLSGYYRHYIKNKLSEHNIDYAYFEKISASDLNELYNVLDLYIVASRVEGGPRAINECALTKTPILSTDVGVASQLLPEKSIFDKENISSILDCETDVEYSAKIAEKYTIENYMRTFTSKLFAS